MGRSNGTNDTFTKGGAQGGGEARVPATQPEILPPSSKRDWHPRPAGEISIPSPVMRYSFFGRPDHAGFQAEVYEVERSEKAVQSLIETRTEKEKVLTEYERACARRELMPALIEQDRLAVYGEVALAKSALQRTLQHFSREEAQSYHNEQNDARAQELKSLDFEIARAEKLQALAGLQTKAAHAERIAQLRAERELQEEEAKVAAARRKAEQARNTRATDSDFDEEDPLEFQRAMAFARKQESIARAARREEAAILARVGGDTSKLTEKEMYELEAIRQARVRAQQAVDASAALGAIFPDEEDVGSRR